MNIFDVIIIGAGPAGLTASIYASRYKLSNLVIGKQLGGELALAHKIENYPGFISISGLELCSKFKEQVERLGARVLLKEVGKIEKVKSEKLKVKSHSSKFKVYLSKDEVYEAKALIVATGSERRRLNIPGEKEYMGKGVSYCTTCDAGFFKDKVVALIGGSDSAVSGAIQTAEYAKKVYIIYRKDQLRAEPVWIDKWKEIETAGKGATIYGTNITEILGDKLVTGIRLDRVYQGNQVLNVDGVFIEIGGVPGTTLVQSLGVKLDETGHAVVAEEMETNIPGLFCAGDMTDKSKIMKQAITAEAQGAIAAGSAYKFIKKEQAPRILGV